MKKCPFCAEDIQDEAIKCRHCGSMLDRPATESPVEGPGKGALPTTAAAAPDKPVVPSRGRGLGIVAVVVGFLMTLSAATAGAAVFLLWFGFAFALSGSKIVRWLGGFLLAVVLAAIGMAMSGAGPTSTEPYRNSQPRASASSGALPTAASIPSSPERSLTAAQRNAVRSAQNYLSVSGFSRRGLIDQLSSEYGDQFSVADATAAVDSLNVDWNAQAARSAANYLSISGFSCRGLIDQLSSEHGDKYTREQAAYGARQAGAC